MENSDMRRARDYLQSLSPDERHTMAQGIITDAEFNEHLDSQFSYLTNFYKDNKQLLLMLILVSRSRADEFGHLPILIPDGWPADGERKRQLQYDLGAKFAADHPELNLIMGFMLSEGWKAEVEKDEEVPYGSLENRPGRIEIVFANGQTIDGRTNHAEWEMVRRGSKLKLEPSHYQPYIYGQNANYSATVWQNLFAGYGQTKAAQL